MIRSSGFTLGAYSNLAETLSLVRSLSRFVSAHDRRSALRHNATRRGVATSVADPYPFPCSSPSQLLVPRQRVAGIFAEA